MAWNEQIPGSSIPPSHILVVCLAGYALGCISTGYYLVRLLLHQDVREVYSGSTGAKNVGRLLGPMGFLITLAMDFGKGSLAVWLVRWWSADERLVLLAMVAVVAGHIWPVQLGFRGGKGIATALGALAVFDFHVALMWPVLLGVGYLALRNQVLAGVAAIGLVPIGASLVEDRSWNIVALSFLAAMVVLAHRKNLTEEILHLMDRRDVQTKTDHT